MTDAAKSEKPRPDSTRNEKNVRSARTASRPGFLPGRNYTESWDGRARDRRRLIEEGSRTLRN